ncbi:MAG: amino acid ABC transporter substrate-binding protein [Solirubrobacterales bacterium]|nr:amino acid ABC transporter substrate-binding protein [Solirubrobacterales bacterium]
MQRKRSWFRTLVGLSTALLVVVGIAACGSDSDDGSSTAAGATAAGDCEPRHEFSTIDDGKLTAVFTAYPPYGYVENGEAVGIDGEIITAFAEAECLELVASDSDSAGIPAMIETGRADVSGGDWWRSKERQEIVAMSDPTYLDNIAVISREGIDTIDGLDGKTIGELQGNFWNEEAKELFGDRYKLYRNQAQVMSDLENGRIDVAFSTPGSAQFYLEEAGLADEFQIKSLQADDRLEATTAAPQAGIMHSLENPELTEALNALIAEMREDGRLQKIVEKYGLPADVIETGEPRYL